jgi:4-amino-4-deoxy-L-arabinose transferase-like glycosyltransferase
MRRERVLVLFLLLVAFGLRAWGLADHNIWWDEGLSVWAARSPVRDILHWTAHDVHPPLYFLLLRGWWLVVGDGEFVLRFPSALVGTLGVSVIYGLGRSLGDRRAGLLSALFLTFSRFAVSWSQEMRMYIWATTLAAGALWATIRLWRSRGEPEGAKRAWVAYVLTVTGGLWSLFLNISVPLITNLAFPLVWLRMGRPRRLLALWLTAQAAAAILFIPWPPYALPRMPTWSTAEPISPPFFVHLYTTMLAVGVPVDLASYTPLTLAAFGALAVGLTGLFRSRRRPAQAGGLLMLVLGLVLPALVVYAVSLPIHLYYAPRLVPRYLLPLSICFYTLLGWGLAALARERRWAGVLASALVIIVALRGLMTFYPGRARRDDYVSLAATLQAHRHPGDRVVLHTDKDWPIFTAHYAHSWEKVPNGASVDEATAEGILAPLWEKADSVWLVLTPDALRNDPQGNIIAWLEARAAAIGTWRFGEHDLHLSTHTPKRAASLHDLAPDFTIPNTQYPISTSPEIAPGITLLAAEIPLPRYHTGDTVHLFLYWDPPPEEAVIVRIQDTEGMTRGEAAVPALKSGSAAQSGPTRQQIDLFLTANLARGDYRVVVQVAEGPQVEVGHFTLLRRTPTTTSQLDDISHPLDLTLGEYIRLLGYDMQTVVEPGGTVELTLYWQATAPVQARYKVFTHLLGETYNASTDNFLWGQQDNEPVDNQVPTTVWAPGAIIADPYHIPVAADAPPGQYRVEVGMYGLVDGVRLPVLADGVTVDDRVLLDPVEVAAQ